MKKLLILLLSISACMAPRNDGNDAVIGINQQKVIETIEGDFKYFDRLHIVADTLLENGSFNYISVEKGGKEVYQYRNADGYDTLDAELIKGTNPLHSRHVSLHKTKEADYLLLTGAQYGCCPTTLTVVKVDTVGYKILFDDEFDVYNIEYGEKGLLLYGHKALTERFGAPMSDTTAGAYNPMFVYSLTDDFRMERGLTRAYNEKEYVFAGYEPNGKLMVASSRTNSFKAFVLTTASREGFVTQPYDSCWFVSHIYAMPNSREIYVSLHYQLTIDESEYIDHSAAPVDSLIYDDGLEVKRSRLPLSIADQYFNLSGLNKIAVYDHNGHIGDANFVRVELLYNLIESQFVAVFEPVKEAPAIPYGAYCIAPAPKTSQELPEISYQEIVDEILTGSIREVLNVAGNPWRVKHVRVAPGERIYSSVSYDNGCFLVETVDGQSKIVMEVKDNVSILDLIPVSLEINGRPALLLQMGVNETDMLWSSLAVYSGTEFTFAEGNRFRNIGE